MDWHAYDVGKKFGLILGGFLVDVYKAPSGPMDVDGSASEPILVRFWIDFGWAFGPILD